MKHLYRIFKLTKSNTDLWVQQGNIEKLMCPENEIQEIDPNVPCVIVLIESLISINNHRYIRFYVTYKGLMQPQGGSGSCYNPVNWDSSRYWRPEGMRNVFDNNNMPKYMQKWVAFDWNQIFYNIANVHLHLYNSTIKDGLYMWNNKYAITHQYGLLIGQIDALAMNKITQDDWSKSMVSIHSYKLKALPCSMK